MLGLLNLQDGSIRVIASLHGGRGTINTKEHYQAAYDVELSEFSFNSGKGIVTWHIGCNT